MKKILCLALCFVFALGLTAYAGDITVEIDGAELAFDAAPVNADDRVLVPMRAVFEALGAEVAWDADAYSVTASLSGEAIRLYIGSDTIDCGIINSDGAAVFSSKKQIDTYARLIGDYTYVPIRAVSEAFDADVTWDGERQRVIIKTADTAGDGNYIFYSSADDYGKIYRVNADGTGRVKVSDASAEMIIYNNEYLYYTDKSGNLWRCGDRGGNNTRLLESGAEILGFYNGKLYCANSAAVYEIADEPEIIAASVENAELHGGYLYYNRDGSAAMLALNLDTYAETSVYMGEIMLSPYNCTFYGEYILVEDGAGYHNIYRFNADGTNKMYINSDNSRICKNQSADENVMYINNDFGQDIYYVNINGKEYGAGIVTDLADTVVYSDVLAQSGDMIFYKNMYRKEIYRTRLGTDETLYIGYGDNLVIVGDKLFIDGDGVYISELDGTGQYQICSRSLDDMLAFGSRIFGADREYGNIISAAYGGGGEQFITNDCVLSWATNMIE